MAEVGKRWTHEDFKAWTQGSTDAGKASEDTLPSNWPDGVEVDSSKRAPWLPPDWRQGMKVTAGTRRRVFVSPEGKFFATKDKVEKELGRTLEDIKEVAAPPRKDWPDWLPTDWTMGQMQVNGDKLRTRYYSPSGQGMYNKDAVEGYALKFPSSGPKPKASSPASPSGPSGSPSSGKPKAKRKDASDASPESKGAAGDGGPASPAPEPAAKRPRPDAATDEEVEGLSGGEPGEGYALQKCRGDAAWLVLPDDVISLDLKAIGGQVEAAGWSCSARDERRWSFAGSPDLVLYPSGKLLVRSGAGEDAGRVAKQYVDSWLALE